MSEYLGSAVYELAVNAAPLDRGMVAARARTEREAAATQRAISTRMTMAGTSLAGFGKAWNRHVALPIAGLGAVSVKASLDFHHAMQQVSEQAGASRKEVAALNGEVLKLAKTSIFSPKQLADALFHIESVGFRGAKAMRVLNAAQKLATVGNSDLETTTYALVSAQETHIKGTEKLGKTIGLLNAIVGAGDMRMENLAAALSSGVLVAAKNVGISLADVGAAMDVMTSRGMLAEESATRLRMTFTLMAAPTDAAAKALASVGLSSTALANTMREKGLPAAVQLLADHLSKLSKTDANAVMARAFGGGRSSAAIMTLVQNVDDLHGRLAAINRTAGVFGEKLKEAKAEPINRLKSAWSSIEVSLVKIGDVLIPAVVPAFEHVAAAVGMIGDDFARLPKGTRAVVIDAAAIALSLGVAARASGTLLKGLGMLGGSRILRTVLSARSGVGAAEAAATTAGSTAATAASASTMRWAIPGTMTRTFAAPMAAAGASAAGGLVAGLRSAIPGAVAVGGVGNIFASAVHHDTHQTLFKSGGMLAGAAVGGLVGGFPGALIGSGLGSVAGGLLGSLFSKPAKKAGYGFADKWAEAVAERVRGGAGAAGLATRRAAQAMIRTLDVLDPQLSRSSRSYRAASSAQVSASRGLTRASQDVASARRRQQRATAALRTAEAQLAAAHKRYPAQSQPVINAEARVIEAKDRDRRATIALRKAERLHGVELAAAKITYRQAWKDNQLLVGSLRDKVQVTQAALAQDVKDIKTKGMSAGRLKALRQDQQAEIDAQKQLNDAQKHAIELSARAAQQIGPKFAAAMKRNQDTIGDFGRSTMHLVDQLGRMGGAFPAASRKAKPGIDSLTTNWAGFADTVYRGEKTTVTNLDKGLAAFGVKPLHLSLAAPPHRQTGGMVVPGSGTGDKVHLQAMVEPGERVFVLNRNASRHLADLQRLNAAVPRFQGGGWMTGLKPGIVNATNALLGHFPGLAITSALRTSMPLGHPDLHNTGEATDTSGPPGLMLKAAEWIKSSGLAARLTEGIHDPNLSIKYGQPVPAGFWGADVWRSHLSHIHMAVVGALGKFAGTAAAHLARVIIQGPSGPLRSLGQGIEDRFTKAASHYLNAHSPTSATGAEPAGAMPRTAASVVGRVSTFGPPGEAAGRTASGLSSSAPGIALNIRPGTDGGWNNATTHGWVSSGQRFQVSIAGHGHPAVLRDIDLGPAGSTGRAIDVTGAGARLLGVDPTHFPTDAIGTATPLGRQLGGLLHLAAGGTIGGRGRRGQRASLNPTRAYIAKKKPKHKARKAHKPRDPIAGALAPFLISVDEALAPLKITVGQLTGRVEALSDQEGLLGTLAGDEHSTFVIGADMPFLAPTLQPGENIFAGMSLPAAHGVYDHFSALSTGDNPQLDLQGQLLDWAGSQADHQLLTPETVGMLASTFGPTQLALAPGMTIPAAQIANLDAQIRTMGGQVLVERAAIGVVDRAVKERKRRRTIINHLARAAKARLDHLNRDLDHLTSKNLHQRLAAAKDAGARNQRVYDAQTERGHLSDLIAHERSIKHPDKTAIAGWEQRQRDLTAFIHSQQHSAGGQVTAARAAILKHDLQDARKGVGDELSKLTGSSTKVGTGGMLATIRDQLSALADGRNTMSGDIADVSQKQIPAAQLERWGIVQSLPETERPTLAAGAAADSSGDTALADALTQQLQNTQTRLLVSQAQYPIFSEFLAHLPKFHTGGILGGGALGDERIYKGRVGEGVFTPEQMAAMAPVGAGVTTSEIADALSQMDLYIGGEKIDERIDVRARAVTAKAISKGRRRTAGATL